MEDVLIVDDEPDARAILRLAVQSRLKYPVREASNGLEALERVREQHPRLIILDMSMPQMDGPTFLRTIRANPDTYDLPVLIFTAHIMSQHQADELRIPLNRILNKGSLRIQQLVETIQAAWNSPAAVTKH